MPKPVGGLTTLLVILLFMGAAVAPRNGISQKTEDPQPITVRGSIWDNTCAKAGSHGKMMPAMHAKDVKECTLACVAKGDELVLFDSDDRIIYRLDAQDKAKEYAGQTVTIRGSFDRATGILHIDSIDAVS
jgi:hypothetical protein